MDKELRQQAQTIVSGAIAAVMPDAAVQRALDGVRFPGQVILVAAGKAAWQMAKAAYGCIPIDRGIVITKYDHVMGPIGNLVCREAGHPVPDENSFSATREALEMVSGLKEEDTVLFLLSGGGSALLEDPLIPPEELQGITQQLLACGADIVEINTIRKRLSRVKGGRFALACHPAQVFSIVLSDIIGDPLDMIASGPACPDSTSCADALAIAEKYQLCLSEAALACLRAETPKALSNVTTRITGSVRELCSAAAECCRSLGFAPTILTDRMTCEAREAGRWLARLALENGHKHKTAMIAGGETVVVLTGSGKGGRNQELALAAAEVLSGMENMCIFSIGSDGTDGPTDAAGGYADGSTASALSRMGISITEVLSENDAYHALKKTNGLIFTGPTGTNVNDVAVVLIG